MWHDEAVVDGRVDGREISSERAVAAPRDARGEKSAAALLALVLLSWGLSLLFFDWCRREIFEPHGESHLILVVPLFAGAVAAALAAVIARHAGRPTVGGTLTHRYGLASGLLGLAAASLLLWLGPEVHEAGAASRELRAVRQVEQLQEALEQHRRERGAYPVGQGSPALHDALVGPYLAAGFPVVDPWGRPFVYEALNAGQGYLLVSTGDDGVPDIPVGAYLDPTLRSQSGDDLVVVRTAAGSEAGGDIPHGAQP